MCGAHKLIVNRRQNSQNHRDSGCQFLQNKAREFMYTTLHFFYTIMHENCQQCPTAAPRKKLKIFITFKTVTKNIK